mmetsp:Transcript_81889/g.196347  ORF Transcript_81889/g.196347 Transcript_81889/m.196347 type:complete len:268 (+) Transcript_81889:1-804(+)
MAHSKDLIESMIIRASRASGRKKRKTRKILRMRSIFSILTLPTAPVLASVPRARTEISSTTASTTRMKSKMFQALRSRLKKKSIRKAYKRRISSTRKTKLQKDESASIPGFSAVLELLHSTSQPTMKELKRIRKAATASKKGEDTMHTMETPLSQFISQRPPKIREALSLNARSLRRIASMSWSFVMPADLAFLAAYFHFLCSLLWVPCKSTAGFASREPAEGTSDSIWHTGSKATHGSGTSSCVSSFGRSSSSSRLCCRSNRASCS